MRRPTDINCGRRARFAREDLLRVDSALRTLLARETLVPEETEMAAAETLMSYRRRIRVTSSSRSYAESDEHYGR